MEEFAWAILENGKINANTVHSRSPVSAMVNWLCTEAGMMLTKNWPDVAIEQQFNRTVAKLGSDAKVVRVRIEVVDASTGNEPGNTSHDQSGGRRGS